MKRFVALHLILVVSATPALADSLRAILPNNKGIKELEVGNTYSAYQKFTEALTEDAWDPRLHLNLGLTYLQNKEIDKAIKEFSVAGELASDQKELQFAARFNTALALQDKGDIDGALLAYQRALEIRPDSKEVKTNIELLWQNSSNSGGKGDKKDKDKNKESEGQGNQEPNEPNEPDDKDEKKDKKPKPFESEDLSEEAMKKILEELKAQEQKVRAEHYSKDAKEMPREKNW